MIACNSHKSSDKPVPANGRSLPPQTRFNNPKVVVQSWYVAARSADVRPGQVKSYDLLNRRIALFRNEQGRIHAVDARCPHLGADLGQGRVEGDQLRCAFHGWRFDAAGACCHAPGLDDIPNRHLRVYPTLERWGLVWIFNGPQPLFDLPETPVDAGRPCRPVRLPPQHINCHPHLVIANGLDIPHLKALHGLVPAAPPTLIANRPYQLTVELQGKPRSPWLQYLTGSRQRDFVANFTTIGASLAWVAFQAPVRFHVLFSGRPAPQGGCQTQTVLFFPVDFGRHYFQAAALMFALLHDDRRILDGLNFLPGFTENDGVLEKFVNQVNGMNTW